MSLPVIATPAAGGACCATSDDAPVKQACCGGRVAPPRVVAGIAVGAGIHGYVPIGVVASGILVVGFLFNAVL